MSAILLSASSNIFNTVKTKDPDAFMIDGTTAIVAKHDAIFCKDVRNAIYSHAGLCASTNQHSRRSEHSIDSEYEYTLQIVHDANIMGPLKFLNVGYGNYSCPWGIWSIFQHSNEKKTLDLEEARELYNSAKIFTYNFSKYNNDHAKRLSYL